MIPILFCGQGGNRTRLVIKILENIYSNKELLLLNSSYDTKDCLSLRISGVHTFEILDNVLKEHGGVNFKIDNNCPIDIEQLDRLTKFKKEIEYELSTSNAKYFYFKEPYIRYLLPYFHRVFPNMKVVYIDRLVYNDIEHYESRTIKNYKYKSKLDKWITLISNRLNLKSEYQRKLDFSNKIKKECFEYLNKHEIKYHIINTDNLIKKELFEKTVRELFVFINVEYDLYKLSNLYSLII